MKTVAVIKTTFFFAAAIAIAATTILTISTTRGTASAPEPQNMIGVWNGFAQTANDPPEPVRTEITTQENRRFGGIVDIGGPHVVEGTVSASGKVNYQGASPIDRIVGKTDLVDYGGGAALLNGTLSRHSNDGRLIIPCVLVMRPFANDPPEPVIPNPAGRYVGTIANLEGQTTGQVDMTLQDPLDPVRPTSFNGGLAIVIGSQTHTFQLLGTINGGRRIIAIAHTAAGHLILDAVLNDPPDPVRPTINGSYTFEFHDGSALEGSFRTELFRSTQS